MKTKQCKQCGKDIDFTKFKGSIITKYIIKYCEKCSLAFKRNVKKNIQEKKAYLTNILNNPKQKKKILKKMKAAGLDKETLEQFKKENNIK